MSFGTYFSSIYTLLGLAGLLVACGFTLWKGGPAERLGALMVLASWVGADIARGFSNEMVPTVVLLVSDILISGGFLYIAIRYSSLWLGAAMIFQAACFAMHAAQLSDGDAPRWHGWIIYLLINNILSYFVLLALIGGTLATMGRRRKRAREKAEADAKALAKAEERAQRLTIQPRPPATAL